MMTAAKMTQIATLSLTFAFALGACFAVPAPPSDQRDNGDGNGDGNGGGNGGGNGDGNGDGDGDGDAPDAGPLADAAPAQVPIELTHSASNIVRSAHSISCTDEDDVHGDTSFYRVFDLATLSGGRPIRVERVDVGIQEANDSNGQGQPMFVRLHTHSGPIVGGQFSEASLTQVALVAETVTDGILQIKKADINGEFAADDTLVVEVAFPDGGFGGNSHQLVIGSNNAGQTGITFVKDTCGAATPRDVADIADGEWADMHLVLSVHGQKL